MRVREHCVAPAIELQIDAAEQRLGAESGFLAGRYQGQTASATLRVGVGRRNAMLGGKDGRSSLNQ
jgi:hypothetical protein